MKIKNKRNQEMINEPLIEEVDEFEAASEEVELDEEVIGDLVEEAILEDEEPEVSDTNPNYRFKDNVVLDVIPAYMKKLPPLIDPKDELNLITRAQNGDEEAREKFIMGNLRLVINIAKKYNNSHNGLELEDLIQEGNRGLMKALDRFDVATGNKFSTYATWWIRQAITRTITDTGKTIRVPVHFNEVVNYFRRTENNMIEELGRYPTKEEVLIRVNELRVAKNKPIISKANFNKILKELQGPTVSFNASAGEEDESELGDFIEDPTANNSNNVINKIANKGFINNIAGIITGNKEKDNYDFNPNFEKQLEVVLLRFGMLDGNPRTLEEVGKIYGLTRERIRQIEAKALRRIQAISSSRTFSFGDDGIEIIGNYVKENGIIPVDITRYSVEGIIRKYNHINKIILIDKNNIENIGGIILSDVENNSEDELNMELEILIQSSEKLVDVLMSPENIGLQYNLSGANVNKIIRKLNNRLKVLLKDYINEYKDIDKAIVNYCIINNIKSINLNDYKHLGITMDKERQYIK